ncbi:MAG: Rpn family recombination-promoting nuclease/putative transposase [bacterium]|nr:Rpn family recombination-promoting nuclease/putative transposase [bacterium]
MKFADPKNDIAFKKIFGDENKKGILISFLNNILNFSGTTKEIIDITLKNPYQVPKLEGLKETILDIKALDKRNIHYIIEMQVIHTPALEKRILYYVSKAYYQQLDKAEDYPRLNQVIFLGFLDFTLFKESPDYATRHLILEEGTHNHYFKDFELNFVELPKFEKSLQQLTDLKDKWIYFVKNAGNMTIIPKEMEEPSEIREAFEVANQLSWTKEELDVYDYIGVNIQDERGRLQHAREEGIKEGTKEGKVIGIEEGKQIGIEEGKQIGIEEGERGKALTVAKELLNNGVAIDIIVKSTGLTREVIESL